MGTLWVLLGIGAAVVGVAAFESAVMRSPKAELSLLEVLLGTIDAVVNAAVQALFRIF
jgi:hypothetical protein